MRNRAFRVGCAPRPCLRLRRKQRPGALPLLQPSLRVRRSALYLVMMPPPSPAPSRARVCVCVCVRGGGGGARTRTRTLYSWPISPAKWLVLQLGGGSGARRSPAFAFHLRVRPLRTEPPRAGSVFRGRLFAGQTE